jgi:cytochrome b6-f complex iron-sulfur subunit
MKTRRRTFLKETSTTIACVCLGCTEHLLAGDIKQSPLAKKGVKVEDSKLIIDLSKYPELKEAGGSETFPADKIKVIVVHPDEGSYVAFENKCTHQGGRLYYKHKDGFMQCSRHGSQFDTKGSVVKGPAALPLTEFRTSLDKDQLTVFLS